MHLTSAEHGVMGSYAIIGAHLPIACGAAWRAQYKGDKDVSVCFFGDGTTNIGAFHEALNFAAVWKLPVIFVCENNLYMEYTPIGDVTAVPHPAADRASAYGLERIVIDGNDADVVYRTAQRRLRQGARRRRPVADRMPDLSPQRPFARRPGKVPPRGRAGALEAARSDQDLSRAAEAVRRLRQAIGEIDAERAQGWSTTRPRPARPRRCRRSISSPPTSMPMEAGHGGTDLSRRGHPRHRAGNGARSRRRVPRRGRGQGRRRVQGDGRALRAVRAVARARHADLRAGDPRRRDGRGDDRPEADRRDHVLGLLRGVLRLHRQRIPQEPLHVERPDSNARWWCAPATARARASARSTPRASRTGA